jgi:predicted nucleic acid-binding protein
MSVERPRVYWDSCIFIYAFKKSPAHYSTILAIENQAKSGELDIFVSALVIAEVVNSKTHGKMADGDIRAIAKYFRNKFIKIVPVDRMVAGAAADIVRNFDLRPPDAIHIATAIRTKCDVFYTYDGDGKTQGLLQRDGMIGIPAIPIKRPGQWGQMMLGMQPKGKEH